MYRLAVMLSLAACGARSAPPSQPVATPAAAAAAPTLTAPTTAAPDARGPAREPAPVAAPPKTAEQPGLVELALPALQGPSGPAITEAELPAGADVSLRWRLWLTARGGGPIVKVLVATRAKPTPRTRIVIVNDIAANGTRYSDVPTEMFTLPFALHDVPARLRATAEYLGGSTLVVELTPQADSAARPTTLTLSHQPAGSSQLSLGVTTADGRTIAVPPDPRQ